MLNIISFVATNFRKAVNFAVSSYFRTGASLAQWVQRWPTDLAVLRVKSHSMREILLKRT